MMPFHCKSSTCCSLVIAALALITIPCPPALAIDGEPVTKTNSRESYRTDVKAEKPAQGVSEWNRHRSAVPREWNRAAARFQPASATGSGREPRIRHVSASGSEDGEVSAAIASEPAETGENVHAESESSAPTSSLSVRQQLLNALQKQREATVGAPSSAIPGSLTIMNSPSVRAQHPAPTPQPEPAVHSDPIQHTEPSVPTPIQPPPSDQYVAPAPAPPFNTGRSRVGLTRTWEADLQSSEPFVRERAQRYLRLEMQLLKLRANQAAAAEHAVPSEHHAVPNTEHTVHAPSAEHGIEPKSAGVATSSLPPEDHHETPDDHSDNHSSGHDPAVSADSAESASQQSSHPLIMENIVVDGPIDRLGLANNLFATGEYPMALEMYQEAVKSELTAQQHFWVEYQTANCLRRLGKPGEASQRYRKLADHPEAGWLSQQARWWVEILEKIRILEKTLSENSYDHHRAMVEELEHPPRHVENPGVPPTASPSSQKEANGNEHAH